MDRREVEDLEAFLTQVGQPSLMAYYGVAADAAVDVRDAALRKRRAWAQGQQANPKYKAEALFLIKNNALLRRVFLDEFEDYLALVATSPSVERIEDLSAFLRSTLGEGKVLSPQGEAAVRLHGRQLGLADNAIDDRIDEGLAKLGAHREGAAPGMDIPSVARTDFYALLLVPPESTAEALEVAYRARYRWARNLKDLKRSSEFLTQLDEAWRVLQDPERRARYDEFRREAIEITDEVAKAALEAAMRGEVDLESDEAPVDPGAPAAPDEKSEPKLLPPPPSAPPPVPMPNISGRTIGLADGPQTVRERAPRLTLAGPSAVRITLRGDHSAEHRIVVQNAGQGRMFARVQVDVPWLRPRTAQLDPNAREQFVVVDIDGARVPPGSAVGTLTVVADHGERRQVRFDVVRSERGFGWLPVLGVVFLAVAAGVVVVGTQLLPKRVATGTPSLQVEVDPVADRVFADDHLVGSGTSVRVPVTGPNTAVNLRVEADGFAPYSEIVAVGSGPMVRKVSLELVDRMDWHPDGQPEVDLGEAAVHAIQALQPQLTTCVGASGGTATFRAWVDPTGQVRGLDLRDATFDVAQSGLCIRRVFRGLRLDPFAGDHALVEVPMKVGP